MMTETQLAPEAWAMPPEQFVNAMYHLFLGREPDMLGFQAHVRDLQESGDPTRTLWGFLGSNECKQHLSLLRGSDQWIYELGRTDPSMDLGFNDMLHELRTEEFKKTQGTSGTMVSVGCSNERYFDWIHEHLGTPAVHIGLEYYSPKPSTLPPNVRWIANTAGDMADVETDSVDLIFGGQVIEHLWADELINFLHECCRILKPGGRLIFDTPNERITRATRWTHAEHTIEFRPDDARALLANLGFTVTKLVGHWLSEGESGLLRLNQLSEGGPYPVTRRMAEGRDQPDACFNWWVEARYEGGPIPDKASTLAIVESMWKRYGHHALNRTTASQVDFLFQKYPGREGRYARANKGWTGYLLQSTQNALPPGKVRIGVDIAPYAFSRSPGYLEVKHPDTGRIFGQRALPVVLDGGLVELEVDIPHTVFAAELNLFVEAEDVMTVRMAFFVEASVYEGEMWDLSSELRPL